MRKFSEVLNEYMTSLEDYKEYCNNDSGSGSYNYSTVRQDELQKLADKLDAFFPLVEENEDQLNEEERI